VTNSGRNTSIKFTCTKVIDACADSEIDTALVYDNVPSDSSLEVVRDVAEKYRANNCDLFAGCA